jgi:hypothetical protein
VLVLLQVLRHLPNRFSADVFGKLTDISGSVVIGCVRALLLPFDLLACWVASTPAVLDLRTVALTAVQWSRLSAAVLERGAHLTEIHIRIPDPPFAPFTPQERARVVAQYMQSCQPCSYSRCTAAAGSRSLHQEKGRKLSGSSVPDEEDEVEEEYRTREQFQTDPKLRSSRESAPVLSTLAGLLPQLTALQHVGLHNLRLQPQPLTEVRQVLMSLPPSVTALTLSTKLSFQEVGPRQRSILFNSIASVKSLRELHMPNWWDIVGDDESCVEPLYYMPQLQAVYSSIGTKIFALIDD